MQHRNMCHRFNLGLVAALHACSPSPSADSRLDQLRERCTTTCQGDQNDCFETCIAAATTDAASDAGAQGGEGLTDPSNAPLYFVDGALAVYPSLGDAATHGIGDGSAPVDGAAPADGAAARDAGVPTRRDARSRPDSGASKPDATPVARPSCTDRVRNGAESDVDCGGTCRKCVLGKQCSKESDCESRRCEEKRCRPALSCAALKAAGLKSGVYELDLSGAEPQRPTKVYCEMSFAGGGWTLVAIYGNDGRPQTFTGNAYPRPGASFYGALDLTVLNGAANGADGGVKNYSIRATELWSRSAREVLAFVGGEVDQFVTAQLPATCNFFDGTTTCAESTYGPFVVRNSAGAPITETGYACTNGRRGPGVEADGYDEFGLHLLDGSEFPDQWHCHRGQNPTGVQAIGRIFTTFEGLEVLSHWSDGVHSSWAAMSAPGALFVR